MVFSSHSRVHNHNQNQKRTLSKSQCSSQHVQHKHSLQYTQSTVLRQKGVIRQKVPDTFPRDEQKKDKKIIREKTELKNKTRIPVDTIQTTDEDLKILDTLKKRYGVQIRNRPLVLDQFAEECFYGNRSERIDEKVEIISLLRKRDLSAVELFAYLGLKYGFGEKDLIQYVYALNSIEKQGFINPKWAVWISVAVKDDLLIELENVLYLNQIVLSSSELVSKLSYLVGKEYALKRINKACNILEVADRIVKLPSNSLGCNGLSMWMHKNYERTSATVPSWNVKWWILKILMEGKATFSDLVKRLGSSGIAKMSERELGNSILVGAGINAALNSLREACLIRAKQELVSRRRTKVYSLAYGVEGMMKRPYLDEGLNIALKAEYDHRVKLKNKDIVDKILRCVNILMEHERTGDGAFKIARTLGENESYIAGVLRGSYPWTNVTEKNILSILPFLEQKSKDCADWLRQKFFPNTA